ncbi:MAG: TlpA disulfide reductase family protein [Pseudomonadota bacterium]|nr:TlpA disulfide reductase family protein [Pseudomonadota bacterium]
MNISPLKAGLIIMPLIGVVAVLYVVFSAMDSGGNGSLDSYATGHMSAFRTEEAPRPQPTVVYTGADGQEIRLSDYRGKVILVNFWATWCAPCVEEMPALSNLQTELGGDAFEVVTISMDRRMEDAATFLTNMQLENLPLIHDSTFGSMAQTGAIGLPMSILYASDGREIGRLPAPAEWDSEDAIRLIEAAIRFHGNL